jgi:micrococcal nuclease
MKPGDIVNVGLPQTTPNTVGIYYDVSKVTDGDTIHVVIEGKDETVRLIGINTPETVDPRRTVECFGKEASARMKEIAKGKIVRLEYDDSQSLRDTYGRLLAYVYLEDGQMLNRKMVAEGYAYEYTYMTPYKYQKEFRELQSLARTAKRGLWAENTCNGSKQFSQ